MIGMNVAETPSSESGYKAYQSENIWSICDHQILAMCIYGKKESSIAFFETKRTITFETDVGSAVFCECRYFFTYASSMCHFEIE